MLPLTEWRLQHCSLRGIRAIRLVVASSNSMLSSDSLETGTGSSNSLFSAYESLEPIPVVASFRRVAIRSFIALHLPSGDSRSRVATAIRRTLAKVFDLVRLRR